MPSMGLILWCLVASAKRFSKRGDMVEHPTFHEHLITGCMCLLLECSQTVCFWNSFKGYALYTHNNTFESKKEHVCVSASSPQAKATKPFSRSVINWFWDVIWWIASHEVVTFLWQELTPYIMRKKLFILYLFSYLFLWHCGIMWVVGYNEKDIGGVGKTAISLCSRLRYMICVHIEQNAKKGDQNTGT